MPTELSPTRTLARLLLLAAVIVSLIWVVFGCEKPKPPNCIGQDIEVPFSPFGGIDVREARPTPDQIHQPPPRPARRLPLYTFASQQQFLDEKFKDDVEEGSLIQRFLALEKKVDELSRRLDAIEKKFAETK